ncbi:MAG: DUF58 domain-containing protein [Faecousia sp.]
MIATKLAWLVLEGLLVWFFLYYGSGPALALAAVMVFLPLVSLPVNLLLRKRLRVRVEAPASLRKGDDGSIAVILENPSLFPALRVRCQVTAQNQLNRETHTQRVMTWAFPKKERPSSLRIGSEYCGRIRIRVDRVVLYDCFGLIGVRSPCDAVTHLTVQPDTFAADVTLIPNPYSIEDSDVYSQDRPGADMTEPYQIREYVPGDSIRQIHWKLSGKFDKLIVRDPALPITRNVLVFWERTGDSGDPELLDAQAEAVISLCRSLLDSGIQFTIGWNDTDRNLCVLHEIHDMDELVGIIPRLLRATGVKNGIGGADLLLRTRPDVLCAHMVYIAEEPGSEITQMQRFGHVTALLCGETPLEGAVVFNAMDYRQQLSQIEL